VVKLFVFRDPNAGFMTRDKFIIRISVVFKYCKYAKFKSILLIASSSGPRASRAPEEKILKRVVYLFIVYHCVKLNIYSMHFTIWLCNVLCSLKIIII
jgi:hypothetical protein